MHYLTISHLAAHYINVDYSISYTKEQAIQVIPQFLEDPTSEQFDLPIYYLS